MRRQASCSPDAQLLRYAGKNSENAQVKSLCGRATGHRNAPATLIFGILESVPARKSCNVG